jgi:hypothetical protein
VTDLLALCEQERFRRTSRHEVHGPCPFCGGTDRFIVFDNGRGWCRQCNWKGDSIQLLRDRDGLSFVEAKRALGLDCSPLSLQRRQRATVHSFALAVAKRAYEGWQRQQLTELTDQYRLLADELDIAGVAYRAIHRCPDLYTTEEQSYWTRRLAYLYDTLPVIEHRLDLLTYNRNEADRFALWKEEVSHERSI